MIQKLHWWVSKENKNSNLKRYIQPCAHCHIIYNNEDIKTTQASIDRWMDKESVIHTDTHTQWNIIQPYKKKEILPTWMDLENRMLREIS